MTAPSDNRPDPIGNAIKSVGSAVSVFLGLVAFLVQFGIFTPEQGAAVDDFGHVVLTAADPLASIVSGLLVAVSGVTAAFAAGKVAKQGTTPVLDPRDAQGARLTPDVTA